MATAPSGGVPAGGASPRLELVVNLTRIYTRTGDDGTTSLGDFSRTSKTDSRLVAYADVDEANSAIGVVLAVAGDELDADIAALLRRVQNDLFDVGADLSTPLTAQQPEHPPLRVTPDVRRRPRGRVRPLERRAGAAAVVHPARRHGGGRAPARGTHRDPAGGALRVGGGRAVRRRSPAA